MPVEAEVCLLCDRGQHRKCTCGRVPIVRMSMGARYPVHEERDRVRSVCIRVGTECSGIEAPIVALRRMGVPHVHMFSTDNNISTRVFAASNYSPCVFHHDITTRDAAALASVDLYVCGFPCQPYSSLNKKKDDNDNRRVISDYVVEAILKSTPRSFVLENVANLKWEAGSRFASIVSSLSSEYHVSHRILTSHDYGIPQSRRRIFIVGVHRAHQVRPFEWPAPIPLERSCLDALDASVPVEEFAVRDAYYMRKVREWEDRGILNPGDASVVCLATVGLKRSAAAVRKQDRIVAPCLTATHPGHYAPHLRRLLTPTESLRLQGFVNVNIPGSLTHQVVRRLAGNAMTVDILIHLFYQVFDSLGIHLPRHYAGAI